MRRVGKVAAWTAGVAIGLPLLVISLVVILLNVDPGRRLVERLAMQLTAGQVVIEGLGGRFPDALTVRHAEVHDVQGAWLTLDAVALDWSPLRLLSTEARVDRLEAGRVQVKRLPVTAPASATPSPADNTPFTLPIRVAVEHLHIARMEIDAPVAGAAAVLALDGNGHLASLQDGDVAITIDRIDTPGRYELSGRLDPARLAAKLNLAEPTGGLIAQIAKLPAVGAISATATVEGPRSAEALALSVSAGPLRASAKGSVDLVNNGADLDVVANAPAITPADGISWQAIALDAHTHGPFTKPTATGHVHVTGLQAAGAGLASLAADIHGNQGEVALTATVDGLRIPGPHPDIFSTAAVAIKANARLDDPARPVAFSLAHPLLQAHGIAQTSGTLGAHVDLALPDVAPLGAAAGVDLQGKASLAVDASTSAGTTRVAVDGTVGIAGGQAPIPRLLGAGAKIGLSVTLASGDVMVERVHVGGSALQLDAHGSDKANVLDLAYQVGLVDLSATASQLTGHVSVAGTATGLVDAIDLTANVSGEVGATGIPPGPVTASVHATGLPAKPAGSIVAQGTLAGAPLDLELTARRDADGVFEAKINRADWKSFHAEGAAKLAAGATLPQGDVNLRMTRLDDLRPLIGQPLSGSVNADLVLNDAGAKLDVQAAKVGVAGSQIGRAVLTARVADPNSRPIVAATLEVQELQAAGLGGSAKLSADGPQDRLALRLAGGLSNLAGADARINAASTLNLPAKQLQLASLEASWKGQTARLLSPVRIGFANGVTLDRLRLGVQQAVLELAGQVSPTLDLTASLRGVSPDLAKPFAPEINADGLVTADAKLTGSTSAPQGNFRLSAVGLRMRTGPARSLPAANISAAAQLQGGGATVDARVTVGPSNIMVTGRAPLSSVGALALQANGMVDLAALNSLLAADGRQVRGRVTINAVVSGTAAAPEVNGAAVLTGGEVQDFAQGVRLTNLAATIQAAGQTVRIASLTGMAGSGTISAAGSVGLQGAMPIDLSVTLRNARPLQSDRLTVDLDADLTLRGALQSALTAGGHVAIKRAEINIPDHLPSSVAVLTVRVAGAKPSPVEKPGASVGLDLALDTPGQIFVRGRGLDAVLAGSLQVHGTTAAPQVSGGFTLQHGTFSLAGTTLTFSRGKVSFEGAGVTNKIDPSLDFEADSTTSTVSAALIVGGFASAPIIKLTSNPPLPQDEVLAQLLFGRSAKDLGPFQYAQIAAALADLSGATSGSNPLDRIRKGLGLDRLAVGSGAGTGATASSATIEAGKYVANGVYVGAKQGTSGAQSQATVQIDITKGLKAETDVGSGTGANSVGLSYQFEY